MVIYTESDLCPNIQKYLGCIPDNFLFYKNYGLKHPSAIYNTSINKIESAVRDFFLLYNTVSEVGVRSFSDADKTMELVKRYKHVLYAFSEHIDDCLNIIKTLVPFVPGQKENRAQYRWLQINAEDFSRDFLCDVQDFKDHLNMVNELKHNNGVILPVCFYSSSDKTEHCLGYFIANVVNDTFEPVEEIHPKFEGASTAFSYRRDLTFNLFQVYKISECLIKFLKEKVKIDLDLMTPEIIVASEQKIKLFEDIMAMPRIFLPDEYLKDVPSIILTNENKLKLEFPSYLSIKPNKLREVVSQHEGDGHTRSFKMPYFK